MITRLKVFKGQNVDPYYNLAVEQTLLESLKEGECILYLWQNRNTVVIGRNQNAWKECRIEQMEKDHVHLARRVSGGGAVFHDPGNLNFTFLMNSEDFDSRKQAYVILTACEAVGIKAQISGRNDLTVNEKKISGSAYYHHLGRSFHHGTLLVNADMEAMDRYLRPSEEKIKAKGVDSVHARVLNLSSVIPAVTVDQMKTAILDAFGKVYGQKVSQILPDDLDETLLNRLWERNRSYEWNYGKEHPFHYSIEKRFPWGEIRMELYLENEVVRRCSIWTDAMDHRFSETLEQCLTNCRFDRKEICSRLSGLGRPEADDICALIQKENLI